MNPYRFAAAVAATALIAISSARAQDIKIGADLPLSGPNAEYGDIFMSGTYRRRTCERRQDLVLVTR